MAFGNIFEGARFENLTLFVMKCYVSEMLGLFLTKKFIDSEFSS